MSALIAFVLLVAFTIAVLLRPVRAILASAMWDSRILRSRFRQRRSKSRSTRGVVFGMFAKSIGAVKT